MTSAEALPPRPAAHRAALLGLGAGALAVLVGALALILADARTGLQHDAGEAAVDVAAAKAAVQVRAAEADRYAWGKTQTVWRGDDAAVCGLVDIDEADDALAGPERFVYVDGELSLESRDGTDALDGKWKDVCE